MEARIFKECIAYKEKGDFIAIDYDSWRDGKPSAFGIPLKEVKKQEELKSYLRSGLGGR